MVEKLHINHNNCVMTHNMVQTPKCWL